MRLLFGIILGAAITIGGAYIYDSSHHAVAAANAPTAAQRPLVNWDVVALKWGHLTDRARAEWRRIASNS
jgi:hypothetical protein